MSDCCNDISLADVISNLKQYSKSVGDNSALLNTFVNGGDNQVVSLGGVNTATLRKLAKDIVETYIKTATKSRLGVVKIGNGLDITAAGLLSLDVETGTGLVFDASGALAIDFTQMPTDKFEEMLMSIRVPIWLAADKTFYVRPDGSDSNDGSANTSAKAFATIQKALDYVATNYNLGTHNVTIQVAAGTYARITPPKYNSTTGSIYVKGAGKGSTKVIVTSGSALSCTIASAGKYTFYDMHFEATKIATGSQAAVNISTTGIEASFCRCSFAFNLPMVGNGGRNIINVSSGSSCTFFVSTEEAIDTDICDFIINRTVAGSCNGLRASGGSISLRCKTTMQNASTLAGFSTAYCDYGGNIRTVTSWVGQDVSMSANGVVTGTKYTVTSNGIIGVGGSPNYFPGTTEGTASTGGQYMP